MADVSVIIPCHNGREHLGQAIESTLTQTDVPKEVFVIDDGSTDGTHEVAQEYARRSDGIVRLIRQKKSGVSKARNAAIDQATARYIAFLDADDAWLPEKTAQQIELFDRHPDAAGTHCAVFNFEQTLDDRRREETERVKDNPSLEDLVRHHYVTTSAAIVRRDALGDLRFDETTGHSEDMILFADIRMRGPWRLVSQPLLAKRIHPGQVTKSPWHRIWAIETRVNWCRNRKDQLGPDLASRLEEEMCANLVRFLEDLYWRRQTEELDQMRRHVEKLCPQALAASFIANARILPKWLYKLRDALPGA